MKQPHSPQRKNPVKYSPRLRAGYLYLCKQLRCLSRIIASLVFNISFDDMWRDTSGRDKIAIRPNTVGSPIYLFEERKLLFNFSWGIGFHDSDSASHTHHRWYGYEHVCMIFVVIHGFEEYVLIVFVDFEQFPFQVLPQSIVDTLATVFGRHDDMVFAVIQAMTASCIFCHATSVARTRWCGKRVHPWAYAQGVIGALKDVEWVELAEVVSLIGGFAFKSENLSKEMKPEYLPVIKIGNVERRKGRYWWDRIS